MHGFLVSESRLNLVQAEEKAVVPQCKSGACSCYLLTSLQARNLMPHIYTHTYNCTYRCMQIHAHTHTHIYIYIYMYIQIDHKYHNEITFNLTRQRTNLALPVGVCYTAIAKHFSTRSTLSC